MRALLITKEGVDEIDIDGDFTSIMAAIGCDLFCQAGRPANGHMAWVDDTGAITATEGTQITIPYWLYDTRLYGKVLITGLDGHGDTAPATIDADRIRPALLVGELKRREADNKLVAHLAPLEILGDADEEE